MKSGLGQRIGRVQPAPLLFAVAITILYSYRAIIIAKCDLATSDGPWQNVAKYQQLWILVPLTFACVWGAYLLDYNAVRNLEGFLSRAKGAFKPERARRIIIEFVLLVIAVTAWSLLRGGAGSDVAKEVLSSMQDEFQKVLLSILVFMLLVVVVLFVKHLRAAIRRDTTLNQAFVACYWAAALLGVHAVAYAGLCWWMIQSSHAIGTFGPERMNALSNSVINDTSRDWMLATFVALPLLRFRECITDQNRGLAAAIVMSSFAALFAAFLTVYSLDYVYLFELRNPGQEFNYEYPLVWQQTQVTSWVYFREVLLAVMLVGSFLWILRCLIPEDFQVKAWLDEKEPKEAEKYILELRGLIEEEADKESKAYNVEVVKHGADWAGIITVQSPSALKIVARAVERWSYSKIGGYTVLTGPSLMVQAGPDQRPRRRALSVDELEMLQAHGEWLRKPKEFDAMWPEYLKVWEKGSKKRERVRRSEAEEAKKLLEHGIPAKAKRSEGEEEGDEE